MTKKDFNKIYNETVTKVGLETAEYIKNNFTTNVLAKKEDISSIFAETLIESVKYTNSVLQKVLLNVLEFDD